MREHRGPSCFVVQSRTRRRFRCFMKLSLGVVVLVVLTGCGGRLATSSPPSPPSTPTVAQQNEFDRTLAAFVAHDAANDWSEASCREVARRFETIGTSPALRDAALAYQRCGLLADGIRVLEKAVTDAKFQDAPALVQLAKLQMLRDGATPEAKTNLQRALAIDDASIAAYDQLALWYLAAKKLDLAALVCSQAITRNASYAPIHNTAGLVEMQLGRVNAALAEFAMARKLDPTLFEAHMNYANVNLGFRGFDQARDALTKALALRPNDYEAHLGMALALRGPLTGMEPDLEARIAAVQAELDAAKKIDPKRPDAYFNEAILGHEYRVRTTMNKPDIEASLRGAAATFEKFVTMAEGKPRYDVAVKRARGRIDDIHATLDFLNGP
jgi:tetratricopeptide (TPR) repeat protein